MTAATVAEAVLLETVLDMARTFGLRTAHFRAAQTKSGRWITPVAGDGKGFPDLVVVGPGGVLYRELKSASGSPSPEQRAWLQALTDAGADAGLWKPRDLWSGAIETQLRALRKARVAS